MDFIISQEESSVSGCAEIDKGDLTKITFLSPDEYRSISVIADETGAPDTYSFEYSGIPATVPKSIAGELSVMFSLFSDSFTDKILGLEDGNFSVQKDICKASFTQNGQSFKIKFNKTTGMPIYMETEKNGISISLAIAEFLT